MGFDVLKRGDGTVEDAFDAIIKYHFDYDDLSNFERGVIKRLVPFYTWTKKALPLMFEELGNNPRKMAQYLKVKNNIERGQEKDTVVPEYFIRQGGIQLPYSYKGENMWILPDLPFKAPLEMLDPAMSISTDISPSERFLTAFGTTATMLTPLLKSPIEWIFQRNLWKGYNFSGRYQQVPTSYRVIPLLMPVLDQLGLAVNQDGKWLMKDHSLHALAQAMPTFTHFRRLFPEEERYQERTLSTWLSFVFGLGVRTNTREQQQRILQSERWEERTERAEERQRVRAARSDP
tara:strand:- start:178 stop:1047 length:870 start_codon:yes stop_codon:yes gene_type:complete